VRGEAVRKMATPWGERSMLIFFVAGEDFPRMFNRWIKGGNKGWFGGLGIASHNFRNRISRGEGGPSNTY